MSEFRLDIDPQRLDQEWLGHSMQFHAAMTAAADAAAEVDQAKAKLAVVSAEMHSAIRSDPVSFGLGEKPPLPAIDAAVVTTTLVKNATKALNQAHYNLRMSQALVDAMECRRKALENLVRLLSLDYNSEPRVPRDTEREAAIKDRMERARRGG